MVRYEKLLYGLNMALSACLNSILGIFSRNVDSTKVRSVVCIKLDEIGDMAASVHVFQNLRDIFPNAKITVLCKPFVQSLIQNDPNIDVFLNDPSELQNYDVWVELRGNWNTFFASILKTNKFRVDRGTVRFKQRGSQPHETITNSRIIEPILLKYASDLELKGVSKLYPSLAEITLAKERIESLNVQKYVVIHPAARRVLRQWPAERFAMIAKHLWEKFAIHTIVVGTKDEIDILENVKSGQDFVKIWISNDSLLTLFSVIQNAELFIGNESGPLQIADLSGIPVIGLFGPGVKNVFYPQRNSRSKVIHSFLECNPCDQIHCSEPIPCIERIQTIEVTQVIDELLSTK
jgi:ADP-heptose:LPS heptosyltransferase